LDLGRCSNKECAEREKKDKISHNILN